MKIKVLDDYVLVEPIEESNETKGGIVIPNQAKELPTTGEVMAIGFGKLLNDGTRAPPEVKVGDIVLYGMYSGTDIELEKKKYKLLKNSEIFGIIEP